MTGHVSEGRMIDLLEDRGSPADWAHVAVCQACRSALEDARSAVGLAATTEIPEPPGIYWEALRRNVSRRVAEEPEPRSRWSWILPLAATAAAVLVIGISLTDRAPMASEPLLPAWSALPAVEDDDGLVVVGGFAVTDGEAMEWPGFEEGRGLGAFVASLSDDESEALVEALRAARPEGDE